MSLSEDVAKILSAVNNQDYDHNPEWHRLRAIETIAALAGAGYRITPVSDARSDEDLALLDAVKTIFGAISRLGEADKSKALPERPQRTAA